MKKVFIILLIVICTISLVACKNKDNAPVDDDSRLIETNYKKVFLLTGQSNASGISHLEYLSDNFSESKVDEYNAGYDNVKISYNVDWGNNVSDGFTNVKVGQGNNSSLFGPELGFAEKMSKYTNETIYIIKCSYSGSELDSQWFDGSYNRGTLYNSFVSYVRTAMDTLDNAKIVGMIWMQGESDGATGKQDRYYQNTKNLLNYLNADLKDYVAESGMAFVDAGIADNWNNYKAINSAKEKLSKESKLYGYFSTSENGLVNNKEPYNSVDRAHYDVASEIKLGQMFAIKIKEILNSNK